MRLHREKHGDKQTAPEQEKRGFYCGMDNLRLETGETRGAAKDVYLGQDLGGLWQLWRGEKKSWKPERRRTKERVGRGEKTQRDARMRVFLFLKTRLLERVYMCVHVHALFLCALLCGSELRDC